MLLKESFCDVLLDAALLNESSSKRRIPVVRREGAKHTAPIIPATIATAMNSNAPKPTFGGHREPGNVHFSANYSWTLASAVAASIRACGAPEVSE